MDKNSYALGMSIAHNLLQSGVKTLEVEDFTAGLKAILSGEPTALSIEEAGAALESFFAELEAEQARRQESAGKVFRKEGEDWLAANASKPGVKVLASGLQYKVIKEGNGAIPADTSMVKVHYEGRTIDGKVFESSYKNGQPVEIRPKQFIPGWTEALTHMPAGSVWEVYIPQELGYGERQAGEIKPFSTLIFKIELISVGK